MTPNEYRKKCDWLAGFYAEAAKTGREMQVYSGFPDKWEKADGGPAMYADPSKWRLKPEPQKAWVVWYNGGGSIWITTDHEKAVSFANHNCSDATIQEIEHPEK